MGMAGRRPAWLEEAVFYEISGVDIHSQAPVIVEETLYRSE